MAVRARGVSAAALSYSRAGRALAAAGAYQWYGITSKKAVTERGTPAATVAQDPCAHVPHQGGCARKIRMRHTLAIGSDCPFCTACAPPWPPAWPEGLMGSRLCPVILYIYTSC
eukprot:5811337-Prymnesium_polylepis.1